MSKLTKLIYGSETDSKKTPFGLLNRQIRANGIINSAGWFNVAGERLGSGDLSLKDLQKIAKNIHNYNGEVFCILNEADSFWNLPADLEYSAPGFDYVIQHCVWVVGYDAVKKAGTIIRLRQDHTPALEETEQDGVKYYRMSREKAYTALNYSPKKKAVKDTPTIEEKKATSKPVKATTPTTPTKAAIMQQLGQMYGNAIGQAPATPTKAAPTTTTSKAAPTTTSKAAPIPINPTAPINPIKKVVKKKAAPKPVSP